MKHVAAFIIGTVLLTSSCAHKEMLPQKEEVESRVSEMTADTEIFTEEGLFPEGIEGPAVAPDGTIFLVNFGRLGTIGKVTPDGECSLFVELPNGSVANGIRFDSNEMMYLADWKNHNVLKLDPQTAEVSVYAHEPKMNQPNDVAIDSRDRIYCSDPNWGDETGNIWRVDTDGTVTLLEENMGTTNGIEVSPDDKYLYVNESVQKRVWRYDLAADGSVSNKKLIHEFPDHGLDGMRCDVNGNVWVTRYAGGKVVKMSPEGEILREVKLHGERPTNIAFGGPDGMTCYVTLQDKGNIETFRADAPGRAFALRQSRQK